MFDDTALWASFATVTGIWLVTVLSPGPNFIATVYAATRRSRRDGLAVAAGITLGTTIWAAASLAGLAVLFETAAWLYTTVKFAGAAYLIWSGIRMIRAARRPASTPATATGWRAFRLGLLTDLSNPKAAAFFTSLFAIAVPPTAPLWFQALLVVSVVVLAGGWYAIAAWLMTAGPVARAYARAERWITGAAGALFVGFGLKLAADR